MSNPFKESWDRLSPKGKRLALISGVVGVLFIGAGMMMGGGEQKQSRVKASQKPDVQLLAGAGDPRRFTDERTQAQISRLTSTVDTLAKQVQNLQSGGSRSGGGGMSPPFSVTGEASPITGVTADVGAPASPASSVDPKLAPAAVVARAAAGLDGLPRSTPIRIGANPTGAPGQSALRRPGSNSDVYGQVPQPAYPLADDTPSSSDGGFSLSMTPGKHRVSSSASDSSTNSPDGGSSDEASPSTGDMVLPLGSIVSGTLLTGLNAPTGTAAKKEPFPTVLRIKHEAILPNMRLMDLRECFIVASGYGDLSSSRVLLRAEGISCVRGDGAILDAPLSAYASGSDGHLGIHGTIVEKTGQIVSRSLLAGVFGGLAKGFQPSATQAISVNPSSDTQSFQMPSAGYVLGSGLLSGASETGQRLSRIYEDLAKEALPVVEVDAGVPVDFIVTRSAVLHFKRTDEFKESPAGRNGQPATTQSTTRQAPTFSSGGSGNMTGINVRDGSSSGYSANRTN